ncbi:MAG: hypothetical protein M1816_005218 [Peltula sp. TS41687]|nr:MAG: hypothetical protein M1816_005218 [Peltula sp. TS41687]
MAISEGLAMDGGAMFDGGDYASNTVTAVAQAQTISADEIALYDRQIRLWGVKAQEKLRTAHVLIITMKALANEIAKNLVLAGVGAVTVVDHELVTEEDLCSQFLVAEDDVGMNRAEAAKSRLQKLNPRVQLHTNTTDIRTQPSSFFSPFDIIIATHLDLHTLIGINASARASNRAFYAAEAHGFYGYMFSDLIRHEYVIERERSNVATKVGHQETPTRSIIDVSTKREANNKTVIELVTKQELYTPLMLAHTAPLPKELVGSRRRAKQISPLLSCFKALWDWQQRPHSFRLLPAVSDFIDVQSFTRIAVEAHKELGLPPETLTSQFLGNFLQNLGSELSPATAFLGGQLAQDVINVLGQREQPVQNFLCFDGLESKGVVYALHPRKEGEEE